MRGDDRKSAKVHWEAFNEANAVTGLVVLAIAGVTYFAGKYDYISVLEYWTLGLFCTVAAIYIGKNAKQSKIPLIGLILLSTAAGALIIYRQHIRYNNYDASWDIAFSNSETEEKDRAVQIGLCILNPNDFPIYTRVAAISANVDKISGSYTNENFGQIRKIGRYSSNSTIFSDAMPIGLADSGPHTGTLQATVEYGRDENKLDKRLNIRSEVGYAQDFGTNTVIGMSIDPTTGDPPNSYNMLEKMRQTKCRRFGT